MSTAEIFIPTQSQLDAFADIHWRSRRDFEYVPDITRWQTPEYWASGKDILGMSKTGHYKGDCDDFALIVRHACRQIDLPNRLVMCWVPPQGGNPGGYHLGTECGGWWSCCNQPRIIERERTGYEYISISDTQPGGPWHFVKGFDPAAPWPHERGAHG